MFSAVKGRYSGNKTVGNYCFWFLFKNVVAARTQATETPELSCVARFLAGEQVNVNLFGDADIVWKLLLWIQRPGIDAVRHLHHKLFSLEGQAVLVSKAQWFLLKKTILSLQFVNKSEITFCKIFVDPWFNPSAFFLQRIRGKIWLGD